MVLGSSLSGAAALAVPGHIAAHGVTSSKLPSTIVCSLLTGLDPASKKPVMETKPIVNVVDRSRRVRKGAAGQLAGADSIGWSCDVVGGTFGRPWPTRKPLFELGGPVAEPVSVVPRRRCALRWTHGLPGCYRCSRWPMKREENGCQRSKCGESEPLARYGCTGVLHELGLAYDSVSLMPRSEGTRSIEYSRLNAGHKVPTLVDGDFVLSESGALVNHLLRTYGGTKGLEPPANDTHLAQYEEWCFFTLMELDATSTYVIRRHLDLPEIYGQAPAAVAAAREHCAQGLITAAMRLGDAEFAMGSDFSGADILLTTCLNSAVRRQIEMPPSLVRYRERTTARDAYRAAFARNHPA